MDNIYGVDLNEESVEITKLSLFLKVCKKDLPLPNLDDNIKCGNSLIDDPKFTDKPFNWEEQFSYIFKENDGFDIVIGNPPYVRQEKFKEIKPYLKDNYRVYTGMADLYVYFFERGIKILKEKGMFSFICANKFTKTKNDKPLRKFILEYQLLKYTDYTGKEVFEDVTTNPAVVIIKKDYLEDNNILINNDFDIPQKRLNDNIWSIKHPEILDLRDKIINKGIQIKDIPDLNIFYGIKTGYDKAFIFDEKIKNKLIKEDFKNESIIKPLLRGKNIKRCSNDFKYLYLLYILGISLYKRKYKGRFKRSRNRI